MKKIGRLGFFLVETMVVIAIVGVVVTFLFRTFSNLYNRFSSSEYYNTIAAVNASGQIKKYIEDKNIDYEILINNEAYVEITYASALNGDYFEGLKNRLGITRMFLIDVPLFFSDDENLTDFNISLRRYLETLREDPAQYKLVVVNRRNGYGSIPVYNYFLTLEGNPSEEYLSYVALNEVFIEPGFEAKDMEGKDLNVNISGFVDTSKPGEYYLTYNLGNLNLRRKVVVYNEIFDYAFTGNYQIFNAPVDGEYEFELWGASDSTYNGRGAYTKGTVYLFRNQTLYIYVGERNTVQNAEAFNGSIGSSGGRPGGGATDIRLVQGNWKNLESLRSRIMIAAGGGAGNVSGAHGGALTGLNAGVVTGGTQTSPGVGPYYPAAFGIGGGGCGGGGGYYGGGGATCAGGGAGGSSFISGHTGVNAIRSDGVHSNQPVHFSGFKFENTQMIAGNSNMPSYENPGSTMSGNSGHGFARITLKNASSTNRLTRVRYIYDQIAGSTSNTGNHWVEIQAYDKSGKNVAFGKSAINASREDGNLSFWSALTDNIVTSNPYISGNNSTQGDRAWVIIDLGQEYDLDHIRVWHYYLNYRTYYQSETRVAGANEIYRTLDDVEYMETPDGRILRP